MGEQSIEPEKALSCEQNQNKNREKTGNHYEIYPPPPDHLRYSTIVIIGENMAETTN